MADATELGLTRDTEVYARTMLEIRFDRAPKLTSLTLNGERTPRS